MKNNRKGRKRKVFKQGKSHISFTGKSVTGNAGAAIISSDLPHKTVFGVKLHLYVNSVSNYY